MKQLSIEEIKIIQMDILSNLDNFCKQNNIRYSIVDGTLLGAVRHKGYIPWDDDIDVCMLRRDYQKFISLFPPVYNEHYKLASLETDPKWTRAYPNLYDDRTLLIENANGENIGINIDIFPVDEVPDDEKELEFYFNRLNWLTKISTLKSLRLRSGRSLTKNLVVLLSHILLSAISPRQLAKKMDKYAQKYNGKGYSRVYECSFGMSDEKPFPKRLFDEVIEYDFEDRRYLGFKDYDSFLSQAYGDYMQLPPIEKRVTHHDYKAWLKN